MGDRRVPTFPGKPELVGPRESGDGYVFAAVRVLQNWKSKISRGDGPSKQRVRSVAAC